jgi:hypothetical protein
MYEWKGNKGPRYMDGAVEYAPKVLLDRPTVLISEEGMLITMEFASLIIQIRQKPGK